ncbi:replication initiation protein [Bacteroides fragilis]|uniref:Putative replication protein n=1 Tax=Bacteroides fragilis (strain YCH46) TaxID=295405 RepID=Q64MB3_BACFR|nr:replication initiation protein [Bacteroides fragilis]BAD51374.1 putative replication protein [Bacteroides fragilis YCH46]
MEKKKAIDKKVIINGEVVKQRKGLPRTNKPVELPSNPTWLKQPNIITLMNFDYKVIQLRILICLLERIQSYIEDAINGKGFEQMLPFEEFKAEKKVAFAIQYSELGVDASEYREVKKLLKELSVIPVELDTIDPITGADSWAVTGLLKAYIPKTKYTKQFTLEIEQEILKAFINVDKGFTRYIKEIAFSTNSKYTLRMYMLMSSWKDKGGFSIRLDKFRKWLHLGVKYPKYRDLYKRIIRPVYEELHEAANCWFEVAEIYQYPGDDEPYKLNFKVIKSAPSKAEQEKLNLQIKAFTNMAALHLRMEDKHIKEVTKLITLSNCSYAMEKVCYLAEYLKENWATIKHPAEYCTKALIDTLKPVEGFIGEEKA